MTLKEELDLARRALAGDLDARNEIVLSMYPFVNKQAWSFCRRWRNMAQEDLVQVGIAKILQEFEHFDPDLGYRPMTYFGWASFRAMQQYCQRSGVISLPTSDNVKGDSKRKAAVKHARRVGSLNAVKHTKDGKETSGIATVAERRLPSPEVDVADAERVEMVRECLRMLPVMWREIVMLRMDGLGLTEIGTIYDLSKERIRQLEAKAHEKIKDLMGNPAVLARAREKRWHREEPND